MTLFKRKDSLDMGDLLFSKRDILKLMIPLILQQILGVTVGVVDTMMVAYKGESAVSGVSLVNTLDTVLVVLFTAITAGGSVVISQALGKNKDGNASDVVKQLLYAVTVVSVLLTTAVLVFRRPILSLLYGDVEASVMQNALDYFSIIALSFPLLAIDGAIGASFRSSGNTFISLMGTLTMNIVNVFGNAILIFGFDMGAKGAALATLISRFVGAMLLLILIHRKKYSTVRIHKLFHYKPDFKVIRSMLDIGVPHGVDSILFHFGKLLTQTVVASLGTAMIAANAVARSLSNYQYMATSACASAMVIVVGRCIGARNAKQARYYSRMIIGFNYIMLWMVILVMMIFLKPLLSTYDLSETSTKLATELLIGHSLLAAIVYPISFTLPSTFRAASDAKYTLKIAMISLWCLRVVGAFVLALETVSVFGLFSFRGLGLGVWGVWLAMFADWIFRTVFFLIHYLTNKWLKPKNLA